MRVHLLGQLAGDLNRLDLRREGAAERPLDEVLDPLLQVSKDADAKAPLGASPARAGERSSSALCAGDNPK
jgi:hypothetical protein